jgi:hypothetical protein
LNPRPCTTRMLRQLFSTEARSLLMSSVVKVSASVIGAAGNNSIHGTACS